MGWNSLRLVLVAVETMTWHHATPACHGWIRAWTIVRQFVDYPPPLPNAFWHPATDRKVLWCRCILAVCLSTRKGWGNSHPNPHQTGRHAKWLSSLEPDLVTLEMAYGTMAPFVEWRQFVHSTMHSDGMQGVLVIVHEGHGLPDKIACCSRSSTCIISGFTSARKSSV